MHTLDTQNAHTFCYHVINGQVQFKATALKKVTFIQVPFRAFTFPFRAFKAFQIQVTFKAFKKVTVKAFQI